MAKVAVSWLSKKQAAVALSTAEAKYVALSAAIQEEIWLRRLLADVGESLEDPIVINKNCQITNVKSGSVVIVKLNI